MEAIIFDSEVVRSDFGPSKIPGLFIYFGLYT